MNIPLCRIRKSVLVSACALICLVGTEAFGDDGVDNHPNIVLILVDDMGWKDVSFNGGVIKTPNIDRIANEGVRLNRFYTAPVCAPTRAGLMTGRYPIHYGFMRGVLMAWHDFELDPNAVIMPQVLAKAGYNHRGIFGKWHLGMRRRAEHPMERGFTRFVGHLSAQIDYFSHTLLGREGAHVDWLHDFESVDEEGYSTDLISDHAVQFVNDHANDDKPFFLYVPYNAPHAPFQAKEEHLPLYEHLEGIPVDSVVGRGVDPDQYEWFAGHAIFGQRLVDTAQCLADRRITGAMDHALDQGIGRILDALDKTGISDNTLVWFMSDNGGNPMNGDNRPFRGAKGNVFEGGIRVAAAARWPAGGVKGGGTITAPLNYLDVLPTLMTITGTEDAVKEELDGVDVLPALQGKPFDENREYYSFCGQLSETREHVTAMEGQWKLIIIGPPLRDRGALEQSDVLLFNLASDPGEENDLASEFPETVAKLSEKALQFRALQPEQHVPLLLDGREGFQPSDLWAFQDTE